MAATVLAARRLAIIEHTSGKKLQVDLGHEQTALIHTWQVVKELDLEAGFCKHGRMVPEGHTPV